MGQKIQLQDKDGTLQYPVTSTTLVVDPNGKTVEERLQEMGQGGGGSITIDTELSDISENAIANKTITLALKDKQNTIKDLDTIRRGAEKGATAVQPGNLAKVATSGSYNDLSNKPTIPTIPDNIYVKPSAGIPKSDLASGVQESLNKADTAIQKVKTINGQKIEGEGNLVIGGGDGGDSSELLTQISVQLDAVESLLDELNDSEIPLIETINEINGEVI